MSAMVKIEGMNDVVDVLTQIMPKEAINLLRGTTLDVAKYFGAEVKELAPEESGELKASIKAKRKRGTKTMIEAVVFIEAPGSHHWHFPEFGTGPDGVEQAYVLRAFQAKKGDIEAKFVSSFTTKLVKRAARVAKSKG